MELTRLLFVILTISFSQSLFGIEKLVDSRCEIPESVALSQQVIQLTLTLSDGTQPVVGSRDGMLNRIEVHDIGSILFRVSALDTDNAEVTFLRPTGDDATAMMLEEIESVRLTRGEATPISSLPRFVTLDEILGEQSATSFDIGREFMSISSTQCCVSCSWGYVCSSSWACCGPDGPCCWIQ